MSVCFIPVFPNLNYNLLSFLFGRSVSLIPSSAFLVQTEVDNNVFELMNRSVYLGRDCTLLFPRGFKRVVSYRAVWGGCFDWGGVLCLVLWVSPRNKSLKKPQIQCVALSRPMLFASFIQETVQTLIFRYVKMLHFRKLFHSLWSVSDSDLNFSSSGTFCSVLKLSFSLKLFEKTNQREICRSWKEILCVKILILPDTPVHEQNCSGSIQVISIETILLAWPEQLLI